MLEHHAHLLAQTVHVNAGLVDLRAFKPDFAAGGRFQKVQAAQEGTFTGAGGANHDDFFSLLDLLVDPLEHMQIAVERVEGFFQILNAYHFLPASFPNA